MIQCFLFQQDFTICSFRQLEANVIQTKEHSHNNQIRSENKSKLFKKKVKTKTRKFSWKDINQRPNGTIHRYMNFLATNFKQSDEWESIKNHLKISKEEEWFQNKEIS